MAAAPGLVVPALAVGVAILALLAATVPGTGSTVAAADPAAVTSGCDLLDPKLSNLSSCVQELLAPMPGGDELHELVREDCCGTVRRSVASGERCVCEFAKEIKRTNIIFFSQDAFELVCGDIRLQQHCEHHRP